MHIKNARTFVNKKYCDNFCVTFLIYCSHTLQLKTREMGLLCECNGMNYIIMDMKAQITYNIVVADISLKV